MSTINDTTKLTVGQEVGVVATHTHKIVKVVKITATGMMTTDEGRRYNRNGQEIKSDVTKYPKGCLVTVDRINEIEAARQQRNTTQKAVVDLRHELDQHRNGYGDYNLPAEVVAALVAVTEMLKKAE